jgi:cytochrome c oxidase cbb3-type subunit 3/ubiquinol-cytochrome c reductase cytochrome c subunit
MKRVANDAFERASGRANGRLWKCWALRRCGFGLLLGALLLSFSGCDGAPGRPRQDADTVRPDRILDFATLYGQNCAACHGDQGKQGAAIALASPVYLAYAGPENLRKTISNGVAGSLMPGFAKSAGGMLTDAQIAALVDGMMRTWGNDAVLNGQKPPAYLAAMPGDAARGKAAFATYCARCHGADGAGLGNAPDGAAHPGPKGSIVDPAYLALMSDQGLRGTIVAGRGGMPDWRSYLEGAGAHPIGEQEIDDIVAWLAAQRIATPGQVYQPRP